MKRLLTILVIVAGITSVTAQPLRYNPIVAPVEYTYFRAKTGLVLPKYPSDPPGTWESGSKYFNTTDSAERLFNGSGWVKLSSSLNFQEKLGKTTRYDYIAGDQTFHNFQSDAYYALRGLYLPSDTTFLSTKITDFTGAVRTSLHIYGPGVTGNPATGEYYIDTARGGSGSVTLPTKTIAARVSAGTGAYENVAIAEGLATIGTSLIAGQPYSNRILSLTGTGDKTSALNSEAAGSTRKTIQFDANENTTITGTYNGQGKEHIFTNGGKFVGGGTAQNVSSAAITTQPQLTRPLLLSRQSIQFFMRLILGFLKPPRLLTIQECFSVFRQPFKATAAKRD